MKRRNVVLLVVGVFAVAFGSGFFAGTMRTAKQTAGHIGDSRLALSVVEAINSLESLRLLEAGELEPLRAHLHKTLQDSVSYARQLAEEGFGPNTGMKLALQEARFSEVLAENTKAAEDFSALARVLANRRQ